MTEVQRVVTDDEDKRRAEAGVRQPAQYACVLGRVLPTCPELSSLPTGSTLTKVEGIHSVPALRGELASFRDHSMEVAQREENGLELGLLGTHLKGLLREVVERLVQVGVHAGRRLVSDLDGGLEHALRQDVELGRWRRLRAHEQPVVVVRLLRTLVHPLFEARQPVRHQVDVLQQNDTPSAPPTATHDAVA